MPSKKESQKDKTRMRSSIKNIFSFLQDDRVCMFLGLAVFVFVVYLVIPYLSYFYTGGVDQSTIDPASGVDLSSSDIDVQNVGGIRGAQLANVLVNNTVGASFIFVILFWAVVGLRLMGVKKFNLTKWFWSCTLLLLWTSLFLSFAFMPLYEDTFFYLGGVYGYEASIWLESQIGKVGVILLLVFMGLSISIYLSEKCIGYIRAFFRGEYFAKFKLKSRKKKEDIDVTEEGLKEDDITIQDTYEQEDVAIQENPSDEVPFVEDTRDAYLSLEEDESEATVSEVIPPVVATPIVQSTEGRDDEPAFEIEATKDELYTGDLLQPYNPKLSLSNYRFPTLDLMIDYGNADPLVNEEEQNMNKQKIIATLKSFGIEIRTIKATVGPTATLYEITPAQGVRISKIRGLEDDIALSLAALGIRIIAPIPGKGTIGIEVPNANPKIVSGRSIIGSTKFQTAKYDLPIAFGKTITNDVFVVDLCKMPHVLVAGATGQGKSVGLNAIITSLLYKKHPSELKFVLIDPKKVEFSIYSAIRNHYLAQIPDADEAIITDVTKVVHTLNSVCILMDRRYDLLKDAKVRNIKEYNEKFINRRLNPEKGHDFMPYIVVVIDEFGDLIMTAGKEIELPIARIAQLARAVGIHMIIATQRPTTNIITGTIKANFPARVAFRVSSMMDSRTILDRPGANQLIGKGDMLFLQGADPIRVQCAFIDTPEVEQITQYIAKQPSFNGPFELPEYVPEDGGANLDDVDTTRLDALFEDAARLVVLNQQGSTSMIQRKFSIGYNRAGRIMDQMEKIGIVGAADGSKPRQVLVVDEVSLEKILNNY